MNWPLKLQNANRYYDTWASKFKCERLEQYYEGFHWKQKHEASIHNYQPYTLNMVYATIKIKLANFLMQRPQYIISPQPGNSDWNQEFAIKSAMLKQDVLNTIVHNQNLNFNENCKLTALDSFFRFGIFEVGYAADWRNPAKMRPLMRSDKSKDYAVGSESDKIVEDQEIPVNERFYYKRIKARRFRVSVSDDESLDKCDWYGYYEYFYKSFLKKTYGIKIPDTYQSSHYSSELSGLAVDHENSELIKAIADDSVCKVWHLWDNISKKRILLLDDLDEVIWETSFEHRSLIDIRWDYRLDGWYPIPPVFQWISPQDEINETLEQLRSYRKRFVRKFQAVVGAVDQEETEKFADGPDGSIIIVKRENAIVPIQNPQIGPEVGESLMLAKDSMNIISGTSNEQRGTADRMTATQSKLIDVRSQLRESVDQIDFNTFMVAIGRETLIQAAEKMTTGLWVKYTNDPGEQMLGEVNPDGPIYQWVAAERFDDGYDFTIAIDVINASPVQMQEEKQKFIEFLAIMNQFPQLAMSPILIREAAYRCGYRNERVIQQMQQAAMLQMMGQVAQGQQNLGGDGAVNSNNSALAAQSEPPTTEMVDNQLQEQIQ